MIKNNFIHLLISHVKLQSKTKQNDKENINIHVGAKKKQEKKKQHPDGFQKKNLTKLLIKLNSWYVQKIGYFNIQNW